MSDEIRVKEISNPVERLYTLDEYSGRLVVHINGKWQFAEQATANENSRDRYREVVEQI